MLVCVGASLIRKGREWESDIQVIGSGKVVKQCQPFIWHMAVEFTPILDLILSLKFVVNPVHQVVDFVTTACFLRLRRFLRL